MPDIRTLILGEKYRSFLEKPLDKHGIHCIFVPYNPHVDTRLAGHADLSVFAPGDGNIFLAPYLKGSSFYTKIADFVPQINFLDIIQDKEYPKDAQMNICSAKEHFIYRPGVSSEFLVNFLSNSGKKGIPVKQGYIKCCTCLTGEKSLISSDPGIAKACSANGFEVLLIENGGIVLDGFSYGFIGGSTVLVNNKLLFTGKLENVPDKKLIINYLESKEIEPVFLTSLPLFDIGSFIPITEKQP